MSAQTRQPKEYRDAAIRINIGQGGAAEEWLFAETLAIVDQGGDDGAIRAELKARGVLDDESAANLLARARTRRTFAQASKDFAAGNTGGEAMAELQRRAQQIAVKEGALGVSDAVLVDQLTKLGASAEAARHVAQSQGVRTSVKSNVNYRIIGGAVLALVGLLAMAAGSPAVAGSLFVVIGLGLAFTGMEFRGEQNKS